MNTDDFKRRVRELPAEFAELERSRPEMQTKRIAAAWRLAEWLRATPEAQEREIARMEAEA